jgi:hypothetical protein
VLSSVQSRFKSESAHQQKKGEQMSSDIDQLKLSIATLFACLAKAMGDGVEDRFRLNVESAYYKLRDVEADHLKTLETLKWTLDMMKE